MSPTVMEILRYAMLSNTIIQEQHRGGSYMLVCSNVKSVLDLLLENKAGVNTVNRFGEKPLCIDL